MGFPGPDSGSGLVLILVLILVFILVLIPHFVNLQTLCCFIRLASMTVAGWSG
jgi:hypothetical protein